MNDQLRSMLGVHDEATTRFRDPIARTSDNAYRLTDTWLQEIHISYTESRNVASMIRVDSFEPEAGADRCSVLANQVENYLAAEKTEQIKTFPRSSYDALLIRGFQPDCDIPESARQVVNNR